MDSKTVGKPQIGLQNSLQETVRFVAQGARQASLEFQANITTSSFTLQTDTVQIELDVFNGKRLVDAAKMHMATGTQDLNVSRIANVDAATVEETDELTVVDVATDSDTISGSKIAAFARFSSEVLVSLDEQSLTETLTDGLVEGLRKVAADRHAASVVAGLDAARTAVGVVDANIYTPVEVLKTFSALPERHRNSSELCFVCNSRSLSGLFEHSSSLLEVDGGVLYLAGAKVLLDSALADGGTALDVPFLVGDFYRGTQTRVSSLRLDMATQASEAYQNDSVDFRAVLWFGSGVRDSSAVAAYSVRKSGG